MLKSIYVKNVLSYFAVAMVSMSIAFMIAHFLFQKQELEKQEAEYISTGKQIIQIYKTLGTHGFNNYLESIKFFPLDIQVYSDQGLVQSNTQFKDFDKINHAKIQLVLHGGVYRGMASSRHGWVGLPFTLKGHPYALFIKPNVKAEFNDLSNILLTVLAIALITAIILILFTTRILVQPVIKMTAATKELARGNFETRMTIKSKDEFGELASSFNYMVQELGKTEQMRKDFVTNVSHEIQSPLASIKGMAVALKDDMVDPTEQKRYFALIELETERLSHLTKQLLSLSSLESGHHSVRLKEYRLDKQIRNTLVSMQTEWLEKDIDIEVDLVDLPFVGDENLMGQVWSNLLTNAIKYNRQYGQIKLNGQVVDEFIEVTITNTGLGIPEKDLPFIFERFYKVDKAHTRNSKGYGLGLAIVKRIIDLHQGAIHVESTMGKDTTFFIRLPMGIQLN